MYNYELYCNIEAENARLTCKLYFVIVVKSGMMTWVFESVERSMGGYESTRCNYIKKLFQT